MLTCFRLLRRLLHSPRPHHLRMLSAKRPSQPNLPAVGHVKPPQACPPLRLSCATPRLSLSHAIRATLYFQSGCLQNAPHRINVDITGGNNSNKACVDSHAALWRPIEGHPGQDVSLDPFSKGNLARFSGLLQALCRGGDCAHAAAGAAETLPWIGVCFLMLKSAQSKSGLGRHLPVAQRSSGRSTVAEPAAPDERPVQSSLLNSCRGRSPCLRRAHPAPHNLVPFDGVGSNCASERVVISGRKPP